MRSRSVLAAVLLTASMPARATTEGSRATFSVIGFTNNGQHAVVKWHLDGGTTDCEGVTRMLLLSLADGKLVDSVTLFASEGCGELKPVSRTAGARRWRARLRREGGVRRGLRLRRARSGLRGKVGPHRIAIHAKLDAPCTRIDQRARLTFSVFNGKVAFREAWQGDVRCGLYEASRDYRKAGRIWAPARLTSGRIEPRGAHALVLFAGRPFVVPLAPMRR